ASLPHRSTPEYRARESRRSFLAGPADRPHHGCSHCWSRSSAVAWRVSLPRCFSTTPQPLPLVTTARDFPPLAAERRGAALSSANLVLRPGRDGAFLVPDLAYPRALRLRL